jgi:4-amino-4-deoxy-L-arabinose transferase-like glycosyltransferase
LTERRSLGHRPKIPVAQGNAPYSASRREGTLTVRVDVAQPDPGGSLTPSPSPFTRALASTRHRWRTEQPWRFWRSPAGQPPWARPALLFVAALAAFGYGWSIDQAYLEPFYGGAARSMSMNLHDFIYGAVDPWGTVSVDKLPGALWIQALSIRIFGFHVWAVVLPQVIEGVLTVLVLYRTVRRVAGAGAGLVAAVVMASSPVVILLDRGNISDSLLILLLVLAADATLRACRSGQLRSLLWAAVLVGFAFQAKMLQAWLVVPALFLAYLVAAPAASFLRRVWHLAAATLAVAVVSLSWMSAISLVPPSSRPYVDGSCNDSVFTQVFSYNGFSRLGAGINTAGYSRRSAYLLTLGRYSALHGFGTSGIAASWDRLLRGSFGHDDAWLLLPAVVASVWLLVVQRRRPRTDLLRAGVLLWSGWLVLTFGFFSGITFLNSYYTAALIPPVAALCGMGAAAAWHRRRQRTVRGALAVLTAATVAAGVALVPGYVGVRAWVVTSSVLVGLSAVGILLASLRTGHESAWSVSVGPALAGVAMLMGSFWAASVVVAATLSPFDSPYAPASVNRNTQEAAASFPSEMAALQKFVARIPESEAADVFETSDATGYYIMATGREFLPIGGFTGQVPAPSLLAFERLVAEGRVVRVTVTTRPLTRAPDLRWVVSHCTRTLVSQYDKIEQATKTVFECAHVAHAGGRLSPAGPTPRSAVPAVPAAARAPAVAGVAAPSRRGQTARRAMQPDQ